MISGPDAEARPASTTVTLFDLNGTVLDPSGMGEPWGDRRLGERVLETAVHTAMADTVVGGYRDFTEHLRSALVIAVAESGLDPSHLERAMEKAQHLSLQPDALPAVTMAAGSGVRLAVLTNSGADAGRAALEAAELASPFERILGVDAVKRFKPHPAAYHHALDELGCPPEDVMLVSAHAWDVWGAKCAGLRAAWVARGHVYAPVAAAPDIEADDLVGAVRQVIATRRD